MARVFPVAMPLLLLAAATASAQQQPTASVTRLDQDTYCIAVAEERRNVFAANVGLGPEDRLRFFAIYDEYEKERDSLERQRFDLVTRWAQSSASLSDDAAFAFASTAGKLQIQEVQLRLKYVDVVRKRMSGRVAARFFQIDDFATTTFRARSLGGVPLASPTER